MYQAKKLKCNIAVIHSSVAQFLCVLTCALLKKKRNQFFLRKNSFNTPYKNISILTESRRISCLLFLSTCLKAISWLLSLTNPIHSAL